MTSERLAVNEIMIDELIEKILREIVEYEDRIMYHEYVIGTEYLEVKKFYQMYGSDMIHVLSCGIGVQSTLVGWRTKISFEAVKKDVLIDDIPF